MPQKVAAQARSCPEVYPCNPVTYFRGVTQKTIYDKGKDDSDLKQSGFRLLHFFIQRRKGPVLSLQLMKARVIQIKFRRNP